MTCYYSAVGEMITQKPLFFLLRCVCVYVHGVVCMCVVWCSVVGVSMCMVCGAVLWVCLCMMCGAVLWVWKDVVKRFWTHIKAFKPHPCI